MTRRDKQATEARPTGDFQGYDERLSVPLWWYLPALLISAILAGEFYFADHGIVMWVPFLVLIPFGLFLTWRFGATRVRIRPAEPTATGQPGELTLTARNVPLPMRYVGSAVALDARTVRQLAGRYGDPSAFVMLRPWIGPGVQLLVLDPDDPTPYWLVSTRRPDALVAALAAGGAAARRV